MIEGGISLHLLCQLVSQNGTLSAAFEVEQQFLFAGDGFAVPGGGMEFPLADGGDDAFIHAMADTAFHGVGKTARSAMLISPVPRASLPGVVSEGRVAGVGVLRDACCGCG